MSKVLLDVEFCVSQRTNAEYGIYSDIPILTGAEIKMRDEPQLDTYLCSKKHQSHGVQRNNQ